MDIQRYKVGYYSDEWGMSSQTPCLLKDSNGYAVKYLDHIEEIERLRKENTELLAALEDIAGIAAKYSGEYPLQVLTIASEAIARVKGAE